MSKVSRRAERRHHRQRMVARAARLFRRGNQGYPALARPHDPQKLADNLAFCRRPCCRSLRDIASGTDRLPFQERRAMAASVAAD